MILQVGNNHRSISLILHILCARLKYIFDQSIWECDGHLDHWFSNTKAFLCGIWNLHREKFYSLGSSDLVFARFF